LARGALFVALRGVTDGHKFLPEAKERGAGAAIVERGRRIDGLACVEVEDTLTALGRLAHFHVERIRGAHRIPLISIGGAAGKTTTKEITAALARAAFGATLSTPGNLNNLIGVPMTLLMLTAAYRAMVVECGTNTRGEIARLASIVEPDVAMVLNVDIEHSEGLGTIEDIADEEAAIVSRAKRAAVIPADDERLRTRVPAHPRAVTFGVGEDASARLVERVATAQGRSAITVRLEAAAVASGVEPVVRCEIALLGRSGAMNCTAALAAIAAAAPARLMHQQLRAMEQALAAMRPVAGRLAVREIGGLVVIDDSYNAQPPSVRIGLEAAREVAERRGARLVIALGDMLELGALAKPAHAVAVQDVFASRPAVFLAIGDSTIEATSAARPRVHDCEVRLCATSAEAAAIVTGLVRKGDVVLVKGSRGIATERIVEALEKSFAG
ncbi:MAG TPA: Mur ligase family protein, partial [Candidatus Binataceae bacterium]|nr:Mur ligase family protein [Candidatus Binataceae bacterium]